MTARTNLGRLSELMAVGLPSSRKAAVDEAIEHCNRSMLDCFNLTVREGGSALEGAVLCREAYKEALPNLSSATQIQAYIACVVAGIELGIWSGKEATVKLYAAQVAMNAIRTKARVTR